MRSQTSTKCKPHGHFGAGALHNPALRIMRERQQNIQRQAAQRSGGIQWLRDRHPQKTKSATATAAGQKKSRKEKVSSAAVSVDLNSASEKDLDSLPGVGPVTAKKIIEHRPYRSVNIWPKPGSRPKRLNVYGHWLPLPNRRPILVPAPFRTNPLRRSPLAPAPCASFD
jgi:hypothetical protein